MVQERGEGIESKCRQRPVQESLAIWKEMVAGSPVGLANCMRFKISVDNPNKAMRDPVAYRCNLIPHIRTGSKYKVHMMYLQFLDQPYTIYKHAQSEYYSVLFMCMRKACMRMYTVNI